MDSYNKKIDENIKAIRIIDAEADEIKNLIKHLSELDQDSRQKVLDTVQAYYELNLDAWPDQLKAMQERMATESENLKKRIEEAAAGGRSRLPGAIPRRLDSEEVALRELVKKFSEAMIAKMLEKKFTEGYTGWDNESIENIEELWESLEDHVKKGSEPENLVDIANLAAFLWNLRRES